MQFVEMPIELMAEGSKNRQVRARLTLVALFTVFFLPVFGAVFIAAVAPHWVPFGRVNQGELVQPPIANVMLAIVPLDAELAHHNPGSTAPWVIAHVGPPRCGTNCEYALVAMRQARLALGKDAHRVQRWWLVTDAVSPSRVKAVIESYPGLRIGLLPPGSPLMPQALSLTAVHTIDPAGFLILQYPSDWQDKERATQGTSGLAGALLKDFKRLLKVSKQP